MLHYDVHVLHDWSIVAVAQISKDVLMKIPITIRIFMFFCRSYKTSIYS